jgi:outer membrane protein assembly factor BamE (lipoprotein component of BamABCDE complex)
MKPAFFALTVLITAFLGGCASVGTKIEQASIEKIEKGKTTKTELIAAFGTPMTASLLGDGRESMMWVYSKAKVKGATFIPVVGAFAGGSETSTQMLQVILNKDKVVEDFTTNNSKMEMRMGS